MKKTIFMAFLIVFLLIMCCQGCGTSGLLKNLPDRSFTSFEYNRIGFGGESHIVAQDGAMIDGRLVVRSLQTELTGPWGKVTTNIRGLNVVDPVGQVEEEEASE